jgi:cyanophycin synthetase
MLSKQELKKLHTNQRLLVEELQNRGIDVNVLFEDLELVKASFAQHSELILDRDSSINPYPASVISGDKYLTKKLLQRESISVVEGEQFSIDQITPALLYAQELGFPIVVKPSFGSHGYDVNMDLETLPQVKMAINSIGNKPFIVEQQFEGKEYRVFITKNNDYAVLHRDPSHVIGDGKRTIEQIAKDETKKRDPKSTSLCPLMLDEVVDKYLARSKKDISYIPKLNEKIYLRHNSNVAMGGMCEDYTDKIHPSVITIAKQTLDVFPGLPYAGIDFLSKDIIIEQTPENYRVLEVNSVPGIKMHMMPGIGKSRNLAVYMVDMIFPETKK